MSSSPRSRFAGWTRAAHSLRARAVCPGCRSRAVAAGGMTPRRAAAAARRARAPLWAHFFFFAGRAPPAADDARIRRHLERPGASGVLRRAATIVRVARAFPWRRSKIGTDVGQGARARAVLRRPGGALGRRGRYGLPWLNWAGRRPRVDRIRPTVTGVAFGAR